MAAQPHGPIGELHAPKVWIWSRTAAAASGQGLIGATVEAIAEASAKTDTAERLIDNFSNSYRMWLIKQ